jgi:molybdopterin converting factor small subunit
MNINVWFYGAFRELATARQRAIQLPDGASLEDLIGSLTQDYGAEFSLQISHLDEYFVMMNGTYCTLPANKDRTLTDGDVIAFIPIITGG